MSEANSEPGAPTGLRRLETVQELDALPDGTVVVWHHPADLNRTGTWYDRQAGVLVTVSDGTREIRPVSVFVYESNFDLRDLTAPLWVLTFDDRPADGHDFFAASEIEQSGLPS